MKFGFRFLGLVWYVLIKGLFFFFFFFLIVVKALTGIFKPRLRQEERGEDAGTSAREYQFQISRVNRYEGYQMQNNSLTKRPGSYLSIKPWEDVI